MRKFIFQLILFCCMTHILQAQNKIKQYEYWLDNNIANRQVVNITPTDKVSLNTTLELSGLTQGLHFLYIRFIDTSNKYSTIITQKIDAFASNPKVMAYEYWFDNDYNNKIKVDITPAKIVLLQNLSLSEFSEGLHSFNIRFLDASSKWSTVQTGKILKAKNTGIQSNTLTGYRFWIDNNFAGNKFTLVNGTTFNTNFMEYIDLTSYPVSSNHILNIQFKDAYGLWSNIQSTHFMNSGGGTLLFNAISGYRYWIDDKFITSVFREINSALACVSLDENIDLNDFKGNNRKFYFQFKDAQGLWSSVTTDTVHVKNNVGFENIYAESKLNIYPNPNRGDFTLSVENVMSDAIITVSNTLGEIIYTNQAIMLDTYKIQLSNIQPGIYFVKINDKKNDKLISTAKILIKN